MSVFARIVATVVAFGGLALLGTPAGAATLETHLQCYVLPAIGLGGSGLLGGGPTPQNAAITNNTGAAIAAGTTYSYTIAGHRYAYKDGAALAAGDHIFVTVPAGTAAGACDATVPRAIVNRNAATTAHSKSMAP
jgi:hypothetical protein